MASAPPQMPSDTRFSDILVIGGGPAGLLLASKLGAHASVRLLEKGKLGRTTKFWLTADDRLARHNLLSCAQYRATRATLGTFQGAFASAEGQFTIVNDKMLLRTLIERCHQGGVQLQEDIKTLSFTLGQELMTVQTTDGQYYARLVVDASGGGSPFAATFRLHHLEGFYSIYGAHLQDVTLHTRDIVAAHVVHFGYPAPIFEMFPTGTSSAYCAIFIISPHVVEPQALRDLFIEHVNNNPFLDTCCLTQTTDEKMGIVPIGRSLRKRMPGLFPIGEASMHQSPLLGAAFNEILEHGDRIALNILEVLERSREKIVAPRVVPPLIKLLNDRLQLSLARPMLNGSLASFERLIKFMKDLGPQRAYRLFRTQLNWADGPSVGRAIANYLLLKG